jgi:hypothetical protein
VSKIGVGAVLSQVYEQKKRVVAYYNKTILGIRKQLLSSAVITGSREILEHFICLPITLS